MQKHCCLFCQRTNKAQSPAQAIQGLNSKPKQKGRSGSSLQPGGEIGKVVNGTKGADGPAAENPLVAEGKSFLNFDMELQRPAAQH